MRTLDRVFVGGYNKASEEFLRFRRARKAERTMECKCVHCNINITDREKSIAFYEKALGLRVVREKTAADESFILTYLGDGSSGFELELTWLRDHPQAYNLGENESHIAFAVADMEAAHALHAQMDCICYENKAMGIYFINDPDGYWLEIVPQREGLA